VKSEGHISFPLLYSEINLLFKSLWEKCFFYHGYLWKISTEAVKGNLGSGISP